MFMLLMNKNTINKYKQRETKKIQGIPCLRLQLLNDLTHYDPKEENVYGFNQQEDVKLK